MIENAERCDVVMGETRFRCDREPGHTGQHRTYLDTVDEVVFFNAPAEFTPKDAFGLLRSYSRHRDYVRLALTRICHALEERAIEHDASKMLDDEFAGFARINAIARINKFGSPEYKESMRQERATIDLHFSRNSHHPERPRLLGEAAEVARGLPDDATYWAAHGAARMTFLDVIEMVCDWWGARRGYDDSRMTWPESVVMNLESKGKYLSDEQKWLVREIAQFFSESATSVDAVDPSVSDPGKPSTRA